TTATSTTSYTESNEFGVPYFQASAYPRYGWLGAKQRSHDTLSGITLMGVRLYNPDSGRFDQTDPVPGGSANPYDYCNQDPINCTDLDGTFSYTLNYKLGATFWSPSQLMRYLAGHFNKLFPIPGAPSSIHVGQKIDLHPYNMPFPVQVARMTGTGWKFNTRRGHPDYPGSISFNFSGTGGKLSLQVHGNVPWYSLGGLTAGRRGYRQVAQHVWSGFAHNLQNFLAHTK